MTERCHLGHIRDLSVLDSELKRVRGDCDGVRLCTDIGYVTRNDDHQRRELAIRRTRDKAAGPTGQNPTLREPFRLKNTTSWIIYSTPSTCGCKPSYAPGECSMTSLAPRTNSRL